MGIISNGEAKTGQGFVRDQAAKENRESLQELMAESFGHLQAGDVITGMVVAVTEDAVVVDVSFKTEGVIPRSEFLDRAGNLTVKVGDEVDVLVEKFDPSTGEIKLSRERAARLRVWEVLETAYREKAPVRGRVLERVKGGLSVDIGVRAFLPGSLVDLRPIRRLEDYVGQDIEARIINFDRRRNNVVLSRKALLEEQLVQQRQETLARLEEGMLVTGTVKNVTDYGVFIDVGGIDGLLHVTDISWGRVGHPSEYFKVGDEAKVVVLKVDRDKGRVSLGYRQRFEDPWTHVEAKYPIGKKVRGKVTSLAEYGAFVELEEGVEGLVHVSELSWTKKVKSPKGLLHVGQEVDVVVTEVDAPRRRLSLSLRQAEPNPWEEFAATHRVGQKVSGKVRNLTEFGAFVELAPGVDGLVHISDLTWSRRISHPSEVLQKGQEVEAIITALDVVNQRISLSIKELLPNEWDTFATGHQVGDEVDGYVTNVTDFGLFVELAPGVEGLCHVSEVERLTSGSLAEEFPKGRKVRCRLIRLDFAERRIGLSLRGIPQPEPSVDQGGGSSKKAKRMETGRRQALSGAPEAEQANEERGEGKA
ncbi:MAG: 30S ribosomal protein S1, partial [Thermoanaerobaculum sp.]|nr:30S ribosomal protein S1 [Thermoanaerobaculum sp.]